MTLRWKILLKMAALVGCFALLGAFSVLGFASLREKNRATEREFGELQAIRLISVRLAASKGTLEQGPAGKEKLVDDLSRVVNDIHQYINGQQDESEESESQADRDHDARERDHAEKALKYVEQMQSEIASKQLLTPVDTSHLGHLLDQGAAELDAVAGTCASFLHLVGSTTHATVRDALVAMSALSAAVLVVTTCVGISLYRSIVLPLRELNSGVREISVGHFTKRLPEHGDPEFLAVIREFNQMAAQLEEFYLRLEEKVAEKSRELVRSERLASVGFLAAGVAHEIRNPLGIISGYAELSLKMLANSDVFRSSTKEGRILGVIRDEAFRCKQITDKLLNLVQGGSEGRQPVDMAQIVQDVMFLVKGLEGFRERHAEFQLRVPQSLCALVHPMELKQVVLNLTLNALDSVEVGTGRIEMEGRRVNGRIELCVRDNGCGMSPDTIDHVFEPFYTTKRGRATPGTGLGLSISHAIVSQHGGMLRAESDGLGRGSRFTIELPAIPEADP
jgi:signal transduction histidine kinase